MDSNVAATAAGQIDTSRTRRRAGECWAALLDPAPRTPHWGWAETLALLLWFAVAGFAVAQHSPWADEMQAWLLAGEVGWKTLFTHSLHYEGTGGLWHAYLKMLQGCGMSFTGARWIAAGIEGAAMAVVLAFAPFPRIARLLLPFTFFLLYQDAVVARSYCLFAVFAFSAAVLLRGARPRPLLLAGLLGLMANISVHAAIASGGLAIAAVFTWRGQWRARRSRAAGALLILLLFWAGAIATMTPAADIDFSAGNNIQRATAKLERQAGLHRTAPPSLIGQRMAGLEPAPLPVHIRHGAARLWNKLARGLGVVTYPLSASRLLALLLVGCMAAQALLTRRSSSGYPGPLGPIGLVPYWLMAVVFTFLYLSPRHVGMLLTGFVVSAWLTWPKYEPGHEGGAQPRGRGLERAAAALLLLVCVEQIAWSAHAIASEHTLPYGPGRMTAEYLKSRGVGAASPDRAPKLAGFYYGSIDPLLYFDRNLYLNQPPHRYWFWSTTMRTYWTARQVLASRPDFIVLGGFESGPDAEITRDWEPVSPPVEGVILNDAFGVAAFFERNGYHQTRLFCGHSWMRSTYAEQLCDTVLEPVRTPAK